MPLVAIQGHTVEQDVHPSRTQYVGAVIIDAKVIAARLNDEHPWYEAQGVGNTAYAVELDHVCCDVCGLQAEGSIVVPGQENVNYTLIPSDSGIVYA
jgi:hypothetical protein